MGIDVGEDVYEVGEFEGVLCGDYGLFGRGGGWGVKSITFLVRGGYSYGLLKSEVGVHRLVRISPFDANKKRHTSFASVSVLPDLGEGVEVEILDKDIKVDTYRAQGAGGQHVNTTDSAVRIRHLETGIVVQCQNDRSQHKNKANALKVLKARLYEYYERERRKDMEEIQGEKKEIGWGESDSFVCISAICDGEGSSDGG